MFFWFDLGKILYKIGMNPEIMKRYHVLVSIVFSCIMITSSFCLMPSESASSVFQYSSMNPILIDGDEALRNQAQVNGWMGDGTEQHPFIIEEYDINGSNYGYCFSISNTTDYFIIRNCYLHHVHRKNTPYASTDSGIKFFDVKYIIPLRFEHYVNSCF